MYASCHYRCHEAQWQGKRTATLKNSVCLTSSIKLKPRPTLCMHSSFCQDLYPHTYFTLSVCWKSFSSYIFSLSINLITSSAISHWPPPHLYFSFLSLLLYHLTISFCVTKTLCSSHCLLFSPLLSVWSCMWVQPWCLGLSVSQQPFNIRNCSQDAEAWHFIFPSTFLFLSVRHSLTHSHKFT